jgi:hypothetical protein
MSFNASCSMYAVTASVQSRCVTPPRLAPAPWPGSVGA